MIPESIKRKNLYQREIVPRVLQWLDDKQATVLLGSRQVGKTSILYLLIQHLLEIGKNPNNLFYLDLENFDQLNLVEEGPESLIRSLRLEGADFSERVYLFIDEIQYLTHPTNFLKLLVDHHSQIKIICTGSSSLEIRRKFKDSLAGRKVVFEILGLSFSEFLRFREEVTLLHIAEQFRYKNLLSSKKQSNVLPETYIHQFQDHFDEYCRYGGYPAITLEPNREKKLNQLNEIYSSYIRKDISSLFSIENIRAFNQLSQLLALGIGNLLNLNTLTADLGISRPTLETYLTILENTFIIKRLPPFFSRKKREVIKMPKLFFLDSGLRNIIIKQFGEMNLRPDRGSLAENYIFSHLYRNLSVLHTLNFWRTKNGMEVDFVLQLEPGDKGEKQILPIEVKYQTMKRPVFPAGLKSFLTFYPANKAVVVTKDFYAIHRYSQTTILFIPAYFMGISQ